MGIFISNQKMNLAKNEGRLTGKCYCQDILAVNMLSICNNGNKLMHDKTPVHKALVSTDFLENEAIDFLQLPAT